MNADSIPTLVVADIPLLLRVAILIIYILGRWGVYSLTGTLRGFRSSRAPVGAGCDSAQNGAHQPSQFLILLSV
jgi:hypothetical protein